MKEALIGFSGVIIGAIIAPTIEFLRAFHQQKRKARYLAVRVICILDNYIEKCHEVTHDDGLDEYQMPDEDGCRSPRIPEPSEPTYPADIDWKSIDHNLSYEILSFGRHIKQADECIKVVSDYVAGPPDYEEYFDERQYRYALLGQKAMNLANCLREKYQLQNFSHEIYENFENIIKTYESKNTEKNITS